MLDSNICIYLLNGASPELTARVAGQDAGTLFVSSVSLAEVAVGYGTDVFTAVDLQSFIRNVKVVEFGEAAAKIYGTLPFKRHSFDRLIAAHALAESMIVVTSNERHFADAPGLTIENWTLPT